MFWSEDELTELQGTEVISRIGKAKSEGQYRTNLLPLILAHPQLFDLTKCGMTAFHRMGSLVLAYSFGRSPDTSDEENEEEYEEKAHEIAMVPLADMLNANPQLNNVAPVRSCLNVGAIISGGVRLGDEIYQGNIQRRANLQYLWQSSQF